jgi:hypothetical protein
VKKKSSFALAFAAANALATCLPTGLAAQMTLSGNGSVQTQSKALTVLHGATVKGGFWLAINPDCSSMGQSVTRIVTPPAHGAIRFAKEGIFPNFTPPNPRVACNRQKVPGVQVYYRANADYLGADSYVVEAFMPGGVLRRYVVTLDIR